MYLCFKYSWKMISDVKKFFFVNFTFYSFLGITLIGILRTGQKNDGTLDNNLKKIIFDQFGIRL